MKLVTDVVHRMNEGYRAWGALKSVLSNRGLGIKAKKCLYEGIIVPTALYGAEAWGMRSAERRKVNVLEMKCLRSFFIVSRMNRVRNEEESGRVGIILIIILLKKDYKTKLANNKIRMAWLILASSLVAFESSPYGSLANRAGGVSELSRSESIVAV